MSVYINALAALHKLTATAQIANRTAVPIVAVLENTDANFCQGSLEYTNNGNK